MSNDSTEPSRATDPELMRLSKARPPSGDLDFTRFAPKKSGAAPSKSSVYDTSRYMEQLREEDPWPDEDAFQDRHETKVTLVACDITTPVADLKFDRPAHARCQLQVLLPKKPDDLSVRLRLQHATSATGPWTDLPEVVSRSISATTANQTVEADLQLSTPNPEPAFGAEVFYRCVATNNQATPKESAAVSLKYVKLASFVGEPDISHPDHSLVPRLGPDGALVRALAAFLHKVAERDPATADKALVLGFSHTEPDTKRNRKLSLQRAEILKSLLDRDNTLWEKHRGDVAVRDKQQILSDLHAAFAFDCDPGKVDDIAGPDTAKGVHGFQKEYNARYLKKDAKGKPLPGEVRLTEDGICGRKTWNGIHRALCALIAKELDPAFADPALPAWQVPDWHYPAGKGAYPCGADFPPATRSAELDLFHPSDAPVLATPVDSAALVLADVPLEDPAKYRKEKLAVRTAGGAALPPPDRAVPVIETYDPSEEVTETGTNSMRVERSGQVVEIRQWVNLTTKDDGRDGKGSKIKLRIRSRDAIRDEANAKPLPDQVFLKVVFSGDGGHIRRSPRSSADNVFQLVGTANLVGLAAPAPATLTRDPAGGWQPAPTAPWEYTATINTAAAKMVEIELDVGLCGGDTCEVQVGATNAYDAARVRFVNWRKLFYEVLLPDCMQASMNTTNPALWDFGAPVKNALDQQMSMGFVQFDVLASHHFPQANAGANTWVPAAFVGEVGGDRYIYASGWPRPTGVAFDPAPDARTNQVSLCHRSFSSTRPTDPVTNAVVNDPVVQVAVARQTDYAVNALPVAPDKRRHCFETATWDNSPSVDVGGLEWTAQVTAAANQVMPTLVIDAAPDPALGVDAYRIEVIGPTGNVAQAFPFTFASGSSVPTGGAVTACVDSVVHCLGRVFCYSMATRTRIRIRHPAADPHGAARQTARRTASTNEFDNRKANVAYHPGLDPNGVPRHGALQAAWFSHPTSRQLRLVLPVRASPNDPFQPGDFAGALSATHCPVRWSARVARTYEILGSSGGGSVILVTQGTPGEVAATLSHELGHSMGLTAFNNGTQNRCAPIPGLPAPKHVDNGGRAYFDASPVGSAGRRGLHRGPHCAAGIPGDPGVANLPGVPDEPAVPVAGAASDLAHAQFSGKKGWCIMFGEGVPGTNRFCGACLSTLKSRTLTNIRDIWNTRF
ncbi:MAG TPA: peptidoglycan-binding domain-containing protein [Fibrobacteria bacterium]|nr:peptidoglycan-binding domain-containing protein [Fibrobacteria bacterium]